MDYEAVVCLVERYTAGEKVFNNFEFTKQFMNHIRMFKDDDVSNAFYRYAIALNEKNREFAYATAKACEDFEKLTKGATFIEEVHERQDYSEYVVVVKHVPSRRFMQHKCFDGSYGVGYSTELSKWVEVFPKERIVIDYE